MIKAYADYTEFETLFGQSEVKRNKPVRTLVALYRGNAGKLALSVLLFIVKNSPVWVIPIVTANIIDIASQPERHTLSELGTNLLVAAIIVVQNIPTHMWHVCLFSQAVRHVEAGLRSTLIRKLQQLSITYHKELRSGKLQSKILRDVEAIEFLSMQFSSTILPVFFNISVALAVTAYKSVEVMLFFLAAIPVSLSLIIIFRKNIRKTNNEFREEIEEMSAKVAEMVEMIPVIRAHGLEAAEVERMDRQLEKVKNKGYHMDKVSSLFGSSSWVAFQSFQLLCLAFTGFLAFQHRITIGEVVLYQGYFSSILNQVSNIINIYPSLVKGIESINSVEELLLANDVEDNRGKRKINDLAGSYMFNNVEFRYSSSDEPVLKNFNLDVKKGECIAFVGGSGAGKTTLLNLVIGFLKPSGGNVTTDGIDISELDMRSYRSFIAVVPQNTLLFSGTILENITYGLPSYDRGKLDEVIECANLREFIDRLPDGIDTIIGEHGGKLSGGQRQRIAIARALMRDPRVVILDEATSALDNISERQVQKAMKSLIKGRTTFIVAHRLSTVRDADRIIVIKDGKCAECGTYEELIDLKGEFYKMKNLQ